MCVQHSLGLCDGNHLRGGDDLGREWHPAGVGQGCQADVLRQVRFKSTLLDKTFNFTIQVSQRPEGAPGIREGWRWINGGWLGYLCTGYLGPWYLGPWYLGTWIPGSLVPGSTWDSPCAGNQPGSRAAKPPVHRCPWVSQQKAQFQRQGHLHYHHHHHCHRHNHCLKLVSRCFTYTPVGQQASQKQQLSKIPGRLIIWTRIVRGAFKKV